MTHRFTGGDPEVGEFLSRQFARGARKQVSCEDFLRRPWPEDSAMAKLQQFASELRETHPQLSLSEAFNRVLLEHPKLYEEYVLEAGLW